MRKHLNCYCGDSSRTRIGCPVLDKYVTSSSEYRAFFSCPRNRPENMTSFSRTGFDQQPETD